mmetsp:Transcript_87014/g.251022  ORF Transcript_87014/g.251022 Transcript_87014/m.251022 type:complete len:350 (-) Transcript_87014:12-1061(-)
MPGDRALNAQATLALPRHWARNHPVTHNFHSAKSLMSSRFSSSIFSKFDKSREMWQVAHQRSDQLCMARTQERPPLYSSMAHGPPALDSGQAAAMSPAGYQVCGAHAVLIARPHSCRPRLLATSQARMNPAAAFARLSMMVYAETPAKSASRPDGKPQSLRKWTSTSTDTPALLTARGPPASCIAASMAVRGKRPGKSTRPAHQRKALPMVSRSSAPAVDCATAWIGSNASSSPRQISCCWQSEKTHLWPATAPLQPSVATRRSAGRAATSSAPCTKLASKAHASHATELARSRSNLKSCSLAAADQMPHKAPCESAATKGTAPAKGAGSSRIGRVLPTAAWADGKSTM